VSEGSTSDGAGLWTVVVGALWSWLCRAVSASHHGLHGPPIGPGLTGHIVPGTTGLRRGPGTTWCGPRADTTR
jgi:hypothetical protein